MALILMGKNVMGQELPALKKVTIKSIVNFAGDIYTYSYTVTNDLDNMGDIYKIEIDISKPERGINLSGEGLINGPRFLKNTSASVLQMTKIQMIPVGLLSPENWSGGLGINGTAGWGSSDEAMFLPGQTLGGFIITSRGLPGIRVFRADPFIDIDTLPDEILPPDDIEAATQLTESLAFLGKTIGPTAPPADFKPVDFLNYFISLKHEAYNLGWIKNKGIENSLDAKLDNAKKKLEQGNVEAAKNILNAFINEVEAQGCVTYEDCSSGKHISPEGYALLKYNAQYLISRL